MASCGAPAASGRGGSDIGGLEREVFIIHNRGEGQGVSAIMLQRRRRKRPRPSLDHRRVQPAASATGEGRVHELSAATEEAEELKRELSATQLKGRKEETTTQTSSTDEDDQKRARCGELDTTEARWSSVQNSLAGELDKASRWSSEVRSSATRQRGRDHDPAELNTAGGGARRQRTALGGDAEAEGKRRRTMGLLWPEGREEASPWSPPPAGRSDGGDGSSLGVSSLPAGEEGKEEEKIRRKVKEKRWQWLLNG